MKGILAILDAYIFISMEGWNKAEKDGLAKFCGNQHNPNWKWKSDLTFDSLIKILEIYVKYGRV